jgi:hypothetical protein
MNDNTHTANTPSSQQIIDNIIATFFGVFDNRNGKIPDFDDFYDLFNERATILKREGNGVRPMCLEEFTEPREAMLTDGTLQDFYEWETEHQTVINGGIASRICRYSKSGLLNGEPYAGEGSKHIQLILTSYGWKIVSVIWEDDA